MSGIVSLHAACAELAAPGTDPEPLARLLAWSVRPRRSLDALRRACRDEATVAADPPARSEEAPVRALPGERLAARAGPIDAGDTGLAAKLVRAWLDLGVRIALVGDPGYPRRLAQGWPHVDAPAWLAWRGEPPHDQPSVAIVGARRSSGYGVAVAAWLADAVASAGARVLAGGARGVDAAAHGAALERPGGTTVVLGCGHAVAYPRPHAQPGGLFDRVLDHGGTLLSELLPYEPPRPPQVRARNRIVAGLADVVVVVEGSDRSGSLVTASAAAERGRTVLAVPGDVRAPGSVAPHRLLADGAAPCTSPDDLLDALAISGEGAGTGAIASPDPGRASVLPPAARALLAASWPRPMPLEDLAARAGLPIAGLLAAVTRARVAGELAEAPDGVVLRRAPAR